MWPPPYMNSSNMFIILRLRRIMLTLYLHVSQVPCSPGQRRGRRPKQLQIVNSSKETVARCCSRNHPRDQVAYLDSSTGLQMASFV